MYNAVAFRAFIREVLGLPPNSVRPANNEADAEGQETQLVTVLEVSEVSDTFSQYERNGSGTTVVNELQGHPVVTLSLQFFRIDAIYNAKKLSNLLKHPISNDRLLSIGLGFISAGEVRNLTGVFNNTISEERAQVTVTFYTITTTALSTESFSTVPVLLNLDGVTSSNEVVAP